jgi:UTP--glucose-1-phosphate uridylyltransferase
MQADDPVLKFRRELCRLEAHLLFMEDNAGLIRAKMETAGLSAAAIRAFLFQYEKLIRKETGLIPEASISPVENLPAIEPVPAKAAELLSRTVVLKLNGGLGTGMGLEKAKSLLKVRQNLTFLDIIARQFLLLRDSIAPDLRLLLMNSFSTSSDTAAALANYTALGDPAGLELLQSKVPKIDAVSLAPINWPANPALEWCPPGHGDIYPSLLGSGCLGRLLREGKEYLFVSNSDNLGATLDIRLLRFFADSQSPFLMEVVTRTAADRKGGHLARRNRDHRLLLRESAQCPDQDLPYFQDIDRHRYFNTNNLWIRLSALRRELDRSDGFLPLPLIRNEKTVNPRDKSTPEVYQLETAMGAGIECFEGATAIQVNRDRFSPVKTTADLLAVGSDAYELDSQFRLVLRPERNGIPPVVKLSDEYKLVDRFEPLIGAGLPSLRRCQSLTVEGKFEFEPEVEIVGDVKFVTHSPETKKIRSGSYDDTEILL